MLRERVYSFCCQNICQQNRIYDLESTSKSINNYKFNSIDIIQQPWNFNNTQEMGKKQKAESTPEAQNPIEDQEKKPLHQFLPRSKYIHKRNIIIKKKKNEAIHTLNLDKIQIKKAIDALLGFAQEHKNPANLFEQEGFIYLEIDVAKVPEQYSIKPTQIKLPVPIYTPQLNSRFTIFSCDPQADFTDKIADLDIPMIREVIGYEKAKKNFKQLKDKRSLIAANDLFFCDWKIYNLLRQPLGKLFYEKKKYPFPIQCSGEVPEQFRQEYSSYEEYLNGLANFTYFMMGNGPVYTIKVGRTSMNSRDLVKNIMHGAYGLASHIGCSGQNVKAEDIRQISIKTYNSPSLPIYNHLSESYVKIHKKVSKKEK